MFVGVLKLTRRSTDEHSNLKPSSVKTMGETFFARTGHIFGPFGE